MSEAVSKLRAHASYTVYRLLKDDYETDKNI